MRLTALLVVTALPLAGTSAPADTVSRVGDVASVLIPAAAAAGSLVKKDHQGLRELALAYGSTMVVVYALKPTIDRTRPSGGGQSFPSGHTASAFAGAAFVQRRYGWRVGVPAYLAASFVGYSRVESDNHYTSDVRAGAAIAIAANLVFTHPLPHTTIVLEGGPHRVGVLVAVAWPSRSRAPRRRGPPREARVGRPASRQTKALRSSRLVAGRPTSSSRPPASPWDAAVASDR